VIRFALLGLGLGAAYNLASQGLILVKRGSGVLNFAQGAFALIGAISLYELRLNSVPLWLALPLAVLGTAVLGALTHLLVMRPLRAASPLARVIATLGIMSLVQEVSYVRFGSGDRIVNSMFPTRAVTPFQGATVSLDRLILLAISVAITTALWAFYRSTRFGLATTAVAESDRIAQLAGHSPDLIATINWAAGGALAGLAGILIAPISGLEVDTLILLIVPALAAGLIGAFESFPLTLAAALATGIAQSEMVRYVSSPGWGQSVPFLVVILAMTVHGQALPLRSHLTDKLPELGRGLFRPRLLATGLVAGLLLTWLTPSDWADALVLTFIGGIVCLSLVVLTGYAGQLSLAQYAFAGIGGLIGARLAAALGLPFPAALVLGTLGAIPAGLIVGLPALRTRGVNLAIATFGCAFAVQNIVFSNLHYTGQLQVHPTLFGWSIDGITHPRRYATVALFALALTAVLVVNLRRSRTGRRLIAVRGNERAAAALGISVYGAKLYAFGLSAGLAGLAGVLAVYRTQFVEFDQFAAFLSISVIIVTVIGGVGYVAGGFIGGASLAGAITPFIVSKLFHSGTVDEYVLIVFDVLLLVTLVVNPNGVAHFNAEAIERRREARKARVTLPERPEHGGALRAEDVSAFPVPVGARVSAVAPKPLRVRDISVRFGGVRALSGVTVEVEPGEVVGIMGPNGAGKTTLIDAITGFVNIAEGSVSLGDKDLRRLSPRRRADLGISRSFQSLELFEELSVEQNIRVAAERQTPMNYVADLVAPSRHATSAVGASAIGVLGLSDTLERRPSELPYGQRRLVAIARAIASEPSVLLLDEPAAGLNETETRELGELIRRLCQDWGMGILLVEHDVSLLMSTCDRIVALDFGVVITSGAPSEVRADPRVIASYLGEVEPDAQPLLSRRSTTDPQREPL
jgi:sulfate-transporting ATPase